MPDENENNIAISELDEALDLTDSAQFPYTQNNGGALTTFKARLTQIAAKIIEGLSFAGINLPTSAGDKTVENSINFLLDSVGGDPNGNISDSYDPATAYVKGDLCIYENVLYICTAPTTGPFDPSKWTATTIDNVIGDLSTLTTSDKSSVVGAVNEVNGAVGALNNPTELTITPYTGVTVTQSSKAYKITDRLICVNFEVTVPTASSSWVNCFDIDWNTAFSTSNFGVVSDGGTNHSIIQAFWSSNKILVRVNSPRAVQYRGQVLIVVK